MPKTITLRRDLFSFGDAGVTFDFATSKFLVAPKTFGTKSVSSLSNHDPLSVKALSSYEYSDYVYGGKFVLDRVGTSIKSGGFYNATYTEKVVTEKTTVAKISPSPLLIGDAVTINFGGSVKFSTIAGKKIGQIITNGDKIVGTGFADTIKLTDKSETLQAGGGDDKIYGRNGNDALSGGSGNDLLDGGAGNDILNGDAGNDTLKGAAGNDKLYGGAGADKLYGGSGKDTFIFKSAKDSTVAKSGLDTIYDFDGKAGDRIDLKAIDANTKLSGDQAFSFIGTKAFSKKAGELRYDKAASDAYVYGDTNGDGKADFAIHFDDAITFSKGYFLL